MRKDQWTPERRALQAEIARQIASKRKPLTEEARRKRSEQSRAQWLDPAFRSRQLKVLAVAREKMDRNKQKVAVAMANRKRFSDPVERAKVGRVSRKWWNDPLGGKFRRVTEEQRRARREAFLKKVAEQNVARMADAALKIEQHKKLSKAYIKQPNKKIRCSEAFRDGQRRRNLRQWTPERRAKQAELAREMVKRRDKEKNRLQLSAALSSRWAKPESHAAQSELNKKMHEAGILQWSRPSRSQVLLMEMIKNVGIKGFAFEVHVDRYSLDVADADRKICVEVDGEFWHALNLTDYKKRDAFLRSRGWKLKRVGTTDAELQRGLAWIIKNL